MTLRIHSRMDAAESSLRRERAERQRLEVENADLRVRLAQVEEESATMRERVDTIERTRP